MTNRSAIGAILGLGLVGSLVLAGCGSTPASTGTSSSSTPAASSSSSAGTTGTATSSPAAGGSATTGPSGSAGGQVQLGLPLNATCFTDDGTPPADGTGFDSSSTTIPSSAVKAGDMTGTVDGTSVHFLIPPVGSSKKSCAQIPAGSTTPITINAKAGKYKQVFFLEGAGNGPGTVDATFNYADGSSDKATLTIDDWCKAATPTAADGVAVVPGADHRNKSDGSADTVKNCGLIGIGTKLNSAKDLKNIVIGNPQAADASNTKFQPNFVAVTLVP